MKKNYFIYIFISLTLISCEKFLSEPPIKSSGVVIETTKDLDNLLNNFVQFYYTRDIAAAFSTDNNDIPIDWYKDDQSGFASYIPFYLRSNSDIEQSTYSPWQQEFSKIAYANTVLENVEKVTGTKAEKDKLTQEAHFVRAYSNFLLATIYCLPYSQENLQTKGLPLKKSMEYTASLKRATLEQTFDFIEEDLAIALNTTAPNGDSWRISIGAVNAFAARYYLYKHDYVNAKLYAGKALLQYNTLVNTKEMIDPQRDYNTYYTVGLDTFNVTVKRPNIFWLRTADQMHYKELYYSRFVNVVQRFVASQELINLYEAEDMRKEYLIEYFSLFYTNYPGGTAYAHFNLSQSALQGPTTSEMYLILAECLIREGSIGLGMAELEKLRIQRFTGTGYVAKAIPTGINAGLKVIIDERRRENPFVWRLYDIKRLNSDPSPLLPVIEVKRTFYPYTAGIVNTSAPLMQYNLYENKLKYAQPIPFSDLQLSLGEIEQNDY